MQKGTNPEVCVVKTVYGESLPLLYPSTWTTAQVLAANLRGQAYQSFDQSGIVTTVKVDFKGNPLVMQRQLVQNYATIIDWNQQQVLEPDVFKTRSSYDALNRPKLTILPD